MEWKKEKESFFLTSHIQCKQSVTKKFGIEGEFSKCTDDHIFEKTLKIELSPIPQAYTLLSCFFVLGILICPLSMILIFDFRIVPTV